MHNPEEWVQQLTAAPQSINNFIYYSTPITFHESTSKECPFASELSLLHTTKCQRQSRYSFQNRELYEFHLSDTSQMTSEWKCPIFLSQGLWRRTLCHAVTPLSNMSTIAHTETWSLWLEPREAQNQPTSKTGALGLTQNSLFNLCQDNTN